MKPYYTNALGRIYHGDCIEVMRMMPPASIDLVITDPPYGVNYVGKTEDALQIENDNIDLQPFLRSVFKEIARVTKPGACWYVTAPAGPQFLDFAVCLQELGVWRQTLVWLKDSMVLGHSDYHYKHEAIFYGWTPGGPHKPVPDRVQTSVWECPRPKRSTMHPTMKPIALFERMIVNSSNELDVVLDPFLGSGTTARACMMTNRRFVCSELDERYCEASQLLCEQTRTGLTPAEQEAGFQTLFE